jgi:CRISPR-associated protein (TIGR03984 family)
MVPMGEVLYAGQVSVNDFPQLVADCGFLPGAFVLVERLPEQVITKATERQDLLCFTHLDQSISLANYTSGRIFDEHAELRWEKQGNTMPVVYLGTKNRAQVLLNYKLQEENNELGKLKSTREKKYFLFGERISSQDLKKIGTAARDGDFAEVRIPRLLRYPVPQDEQRYVRLIVREYLDEENTVVLFRFQDLKQWSSQP